ncbi:MAG: hypothetical protein KME11_20190 [Timaviella obliquedivisa GSE-PSE-MK23-08B]|jgi:hypothetical protein|nr:hypothetical protein [Timaviella obliquedivisa GSE-PSE-MK23-08B]
MLDAIAAVDNLGMEDSALAADVSVTSLDTNAALTESQGSSIQSADFDQSLMDMLSSLDALGNDTNPSLRIVSGQSLEDALADAIPGLDPTTITPPDPFAEEGSLSSLEAPVDVTNPSLQVVSGQSLEDALADAIPGLDSTTVTPPAPLAQDSSLSIAEDASLNPFMMAALSELDNAESIGEAFQAVSDGFEGLSDSFEQLAASFLAQDSNVDTAAIDASSDDASADLEANNVAIDDGENAANANFDADSVETKNVSNDDDNTDSDTRFDTDSNLDSSSHSHDGSHDHSDKVAIANDADDINADFGISNLISNDDDITLGTDFDLDFDALKVNVGQISRGLQFLVQQLEAAFEGDDSSLTAASTFNSSR